MPISPRKSPARALALAKGFRSGLEDTVAQELTSKGILFEYEKHTLKYLVPSRIAKYTPDFSLPNGIIVETKGLWDSDDRKKIELVLKEFPELDLRIVFNNPNAKIVKGSKTTYAMICAKLGIKYAAKSIPAAWLEEAPNELSLAMLATFRKETPTK